MAASNVFPCLKLQETGKEGRFSQAQEGFLDDFGVEQLFSCSLLDGPAGLKHIATVGQFEGFPDLLLDEENRLSGLFQFSHGFQHLIHQFWHQTKRRFIEHQEFWTGHQSSSNGQHLLLTPAEGPALLEASLGQTRKEVIDFLQIPFHLFSIIEDVGAQFQIFLNRKRSKD